MAANTLSNLLADMDLPGLIINLERYGWFHIVFPFLLVYAIVFTILNQISLFEERKPVKVIVAFVFAIFSVSFPINAFGETIGDLMILLFPKVTAVTMGILSLYIIAAMLGVDLMSFLGKDNENNNIIRYILGAIGLLIVGYYFGIAMDWWRDDFRNLWLIQLLTDPLLWVIVVFVFFFWYLSKDDSEDHRKKHKDDGTHVHIDNGGHKHH